MSFQTEVDPEYTFSLLTKTYCYRLQTPFGERIINTRCKNLREAKRLVRETMAEELAVAAQTMRFTQEVISQLTIGRKALKCEEALLEYVEWCKRHHAASGINCTIQTLANGMHFMGVTKGFVTDITEELLDRQINPDDGTPERSRSQRLVQWRGFFKWLSNKYPYRNVCSLIKVDTRKLLHEHRAVRKPHHVIQDADFEKTVAFLRMEYDELQVERRTRIQESMTNGKRLRLDKINFDIDITVFHLVGFLIARFTGLRLGDIMNLEWATLDEALGGQLRLWTKKTNTKIQMPLPARVREALIMVPRTDKFLFPMVRAEHRQFQLTNRSGRVQLYRILARIYQKAEVPKFNWHDFRHTFASEVEAKYGVKLASQWLGHSSVSMTERYVHRGMLEQAPVALLEGYDLAPPPESEDTVVPMVQEAVG